MSHRNQEESRLVSRAAIMAIVIVAILAVSGAYYFTTVLGGSANSVTVNIEVTNGTTQNGAADIFEPRNFTVTEGQHVTIVFDNTDDGPHELAIPQFGVNTGIVQGGSTVRVNFTPNQTGTFEYYEPAGVCAENAGAAACTGQQETSGNMTVLAP
jgi:heme/copper-type cytochrome/quinol oxidase subunit 2